MPKIGDRVRMLNDRSEHIITDIAYHEDHEETYAYFDGDTRDSQDGWDFPSFEVIDNELEELRAWKASALARFPALAKPETDDEAAERFEDAIMHSDHSYDEVIREMFAWARANPR